MSARPVRRLAPEPLRALARYAAAMAARDAAAAARALADARRLGASRVAAEETALMLVLYAGYPAALEGARTLLGTWPGRPRASDEGDRARWRARGRALIARVYGPVFDRLEANVTRMHPDLATWMIEDGYGRVLARPGLDAAARECIAVAVLAAGGWERQLLSHLLGAARLGAPRAAIRDAWGVGFARADRRGRIACDLAWSAFEAAAPAPPRRTGAGAPRPARAPRRRAGTGRGRRGTRARG